MKTTQAARVIGACALLIANGAAPGSATFPADPPGEPAIVLSDVSRFYQIYDAARERPSAESLQHEYLEAGSAGLQRISKLRNLTGARIAENLAAHPNLYVNARTCVAILPRVREHLLLAFRELARRYPEAQFPPVTVFVGRGKPVGVGDETGVMIGLESLCGVTWMESNLEDRFVHVIAHEYAHVQQALASPAFYNDDKPTVLAQSLIEGAAEFVAELISGGVSDVHLKALMAGQEQARESAFIADKDDTDLSKWLYNATMTTPGDYGYGVGYRIAKSYYMHANDKRQALRDIIGISDANAFLAKSKWRPGIELR